MQTEILAEFATIATIHLFAVASPGPDFAIVLQQSIHAGRRAAVFTSLGIASGILFHAAYCVAGLGYLLNAHPATLQILKYAGAVYLAWLGARSLRGGLRAAARARDASADRQANRPCDEDTGTADAAAEAKDKQDACPTLSTSRPCDESGLPAAAAAPVQTARGAFLRGLGVNLLNPKVALFFVAIFAGLADHNPPLARRVFYGAWMSVVTFAWFSCVAFLFTQPRVRVVFLRAACLVDILLGLLLLLFALSLALL